MNYYWELMSLMNATISEWNVKVVGLESSNKNRSSMSLCTARILKPNASFVGPFFHLKRYLITLRIVMKET